MKTTPRERDIEKHLVKLCKRFGWECWKLTSPARRGVPDRLIIAPGVVVFVEVKRPGGKVTPLQARTLQKLQALHQKAVVVFSKEQVDELTHLVAKYSARAMQ